MLRLLSVATVGFSFRLAGPSTVRGTKWRMRMVSGDTAFRRGLALLKPEEGVTVYRGGNKGLDQKTVARDYTIGRPIQWAAFSSTTTSPSAVRLFVRKNEGIIYSTQILYVVMSHQ